MIFHPFSRPGWGIRGATDRRPLIGKLRGGLSCRRGAYVTTHDKTGAGRSRCGTRARHRAPGEPSVLRRRGGWRPPAPAARSGRRGRRRGGRHGSARARAAGLDPRWWRWSGLARRPSRGSAARAAQLASGLAASHGRGRICAVLPAGARRRRRRWRTRPPAAKASVHIEMPRLPRQPADESTQPAASPACSMARHGAGEADHRWRSLPSSPSRDRRNAGVQPAEAVILFGPPGTGRPVFAKAIASRRAGRRGVVPRRGWPLHRRPGRPLPGGVRRAGQLDELVLFIDEVGEIAVRAFGRDDRRQGDRGEASS